MNTEAFASSGDESKRVVVPSKGELKYQKYYWRVVDFVIRTIASLQRGECLAIAAYVAHELPL